MGSAVFLLATKLRVLQWHSVRLQFHNWYQVDKDPKNNTAENLDDSIIASKLNDDSVQ